MSELATTNQRSEVAVFRGLQLTTMDDIMRFCTIAANSGLAPKELRTPEACFIAVTMGLEVGLSPTQALQSVCVINGKPAIYGDAALALVTSKPDCLDIIETFSGKGEDDEGMSATCEVLRRDRTPVKRTFTTKAAKKAGLWGKSGPWTLYPPRMLQMRARSWALRDSFPDALKGIGIVEEVRDIPAEKVRIIQPEKPEGLVLPDETDDRPIQLLAPDDLAPKPAGAEPVTEEQPDPITKEFKF